MGKKERGFRDGSGPYSMKRRKAKSICPFDKESKENIEDMKFEINIKTKAKIVSDKVGAGEFIK